MVLRVCRVARWCATGVLVVALFFPLSRCAVQQPLEDEPAQETPKEYTYTYAWTDFNPATASSWLALLIFVWPLAFLASDVFSRRQRFPFIRCAGQILLAGASICMLYLRTFLDELWYGGYLAYSALGIYLLACLVELAWRIRERVRSRKMGPQGLEPSEPVFGRSP